MNDDVRAVSAALVEVCFTPDGPVPSPATIRLVDDAIADAAIVLDERFDDLGEELVRACFGLLSEVRTLAGDRYRCGAAADALVRHVATVATSEPAGYAPLLRTLAALAILPVAADDDPAMDPTPDPASAVERALAGSSRDALDAAVHDATFHVPVLDLTSEADGALGVQFVPVVIEGTPCISVFTTRERVDHHVRLAGVPVEAIPVIEVAGRELPELCPPGHGVAINPGMVLGYAFRPAGGPSSAPVG